VTTRKDPVARVPLPAPASIGLRGDLTAAERWRLAWAGFVRAGLWPHMTTKARGAIWRKRARVPTIVGLLVVGVVLNARAFGVPLSELWPLWLGGTALVLALPGIAYLLHTAGRHQVIYLSPSADVTVRLASTKAGGWRVDQHVKLPGANARAFRRTVLAQLLPIAREQGVHVTLTAAGERLAEVYAADVAHAEAQAGHPTPGELVARTPRRVLGIPIRDPFGSIPMVWKP
jgi:hypothetical protein